MGIVLSIKNTDFNINQSDSGPNQASTDLFWMHKALVLAQKAATKDEVPVGALIVSDQNELISTAFNLKESLQSPLGHAEILALHKAAKKLSSWRLLNCTMYVTLEPCLMCAGTIIQSRLKRLVYGANDPKAGAVTSLYKTLGDSRLNHQVQITSGILQMECGEILSQYFKQKRQDKGKKYVR